MPDTATREGASCASLAARDRGLLWHPYEALDGPAPYTVAAARGVTLTLVTPDGELWGYTGAIGERADRGLTPAGWHVYALMGKPDGDDTAMFNDVTTCCHA